MGKDDTFRNCIITAENNVLVALKKEIVIMDDSLATVKSISPKELDHDTTIFTLQACNVSFERSKLLLTFGVEECSKFKLDYTGTGSFDSWVTKVTW